MSDFTDLMSGRMNLAQFVAKEEANVAHLIAQAPADIQPAVKTFIDDSRAVLTTGADWAGTAVAGVIAAEGDALKTAVVAALSKLGLNGPVTAATQDGFSAASAVLQAMVAHWVVEFKTATSPPASPAA